MTVPEITPRELFEALGNGEKLQVVDVRAPARVESGRVHPVPDALFRNIPGSTLMAATDLRAVGVDPAVPVVVVCGHGNDSRICAAVLNRMGASARSLAGGMASWMNLSVARSLPPPAGLDHLVQFDRIGKASLGYLLASSGESMIIDPPRDPGPFLAMAATLGTRLIAVVDTHVHADYISGAAALSASTGVPYYLHPADGVSPYDGSPGRIDTRSLHDGLTLRLGRCTLEVVHTPGHSPGSVSLRIGDEAAFTGDFLFVESVGRPDIADRTEEWSVLLWRSIRAVREQWPRGIIIYPAHYGSEGERGKDGAVSAPLGELVLRNPSLRFQDEHAFSVWIAANRTAVPPAYRAMKEINLGILSAGERESDELESGKNECAI